MHAELPVKLTYVPVVQPEHTLLPFEDVNDPAAHSVQFVCPNKANVPIEQFKQYELPVAFVYFPARHSLHGAVPTTGANVPALHEVQLEAFPAFEKPMEQL